MLVQLVDLLRCEVFELFGSYVPFKSQQARRIVLIRPFYLLFDVLIFRDEILGLADTGGEEHLISEMVTVVASSDHDGQHVRLVQVLRRFLFNFYRALHDDTVIVD